MKNESYAARLERGFADAPTTSLADRVEALKAERDAIKQQAQIWKMEAATYKSTVQECYQACTGATGEPGSWHGANPVLELVRERDALQADASRYRWIVYAGWFDEEIMKEHEIIDGFSDTVDAAIDAAMAMQS